MARYKGSAAVSAFKGKLGDVVGVGGSGNGYLKERTQPKNPQTTFQQTVRNQLTTVSKGWSLLSTQEINNWNEAAVNENRADKRKSFGGKHRLSGKSFYTERNLNRLEVGLAVSGTIFPAGTQADVTLTKINFDVANDKVTLDGTVTTAAASWANISITPPQSAGTRAFKGRYKVFGTINLATFTDGDDITTLYNKRFASIPSSGNMRAFATRYSQNGIIYAIDQLEVTFV